MYPVYETVSNLVLVVAAELRKFAAAHDAGEFHGVHDEISHVRELIDRSGQLEEQAFDDLDAVQFWLLDVAIISSHLWD